MTRVVLRPTLLWALHVDTRIPTWKLVLVILALHSDEHNNAQLYHHELLDMMNGLSKRTLGNALQGLEALGLITRINRFHNASVYHLNVEEPHDHTPGPRAFTPGQKGSAGDGAVAPAQRTV